MVALSKRNNFTTKLRDCGLKVTEKRLQIAELLFTEDSRHVTATQLYSEALKKRLKVSVATIYNTLNQFTKVGLLRKIQVSDEPARFDTRVSNHYHFYYEDLEKLVDIDTDEIQYSLPEPPPGTSISGVDVIIRLKST